MSLSSPSLCSTVCLCDSLFPTLLPHILSQTLICCYHSFSFSNFIYIKWHTVFKTSPCLAAVQLFVVFAEHGSHVWIRHSLFTHTPMATYVGANWGVLKINHILAFIYFVKKIIFSLLLFKVSCWPFNHMCVCLCTCVQHRSSRGASTLDISHLSNSHFPFFLVKYLAVKELNYMYLGLSF